MKLLLEQSDLGPTSGKSIAEFADPMYGFTVLVEQRPDGQPTFARIKHRGAGCIVFHDQITVEIEGVGIIGKPQSAAEEPAPASTPKRNERGQFVKAEDAEPALTGPRLQDTSAWFED